MKRTFVIVLSTVLLICCPAFAATVDAVKGKVLINRGDGFQQATTGTQANAGDLLMANAGGSATLVYPRGCQVSVIPGRVVSVGKQPPCTAQSLVGEDYREGFWNTPVPFAIGAAVGWGIFCATTYCRDHNDEGRSRRAAGGAVAVAAVPVAHRLAPDKRSLLSALERDFACLRRETTRSGPVHGLYQRRSKPQHSGLSVRLDLAHRLLPRSLLLSHSFLSGPDCLCSFSIGDFVNPFRFSQR